jgi:hypothetical protein
VHVIRERQFLLLPPLLPLPHRQHHARQTRHYQANGVRETARRRRQRLAVAIRQAERRPATQETHSC